ALFWLLQHETQAGVIALVLDAGKAAALALEARAASFSYADAIEGTIGTAGQRLSQHRLQMVSQKRDAQLACQLVKGILGKAVLLPQGRKGGFPLLLLGAGESTGLLPRRICAHAAQALLPCGEHGIVELSPCFQVCPQAFGLSLMHDQG